MDTYRLVIVFGTLLVYRTSTSHCEDVSSNCTASTRKPVDTTLVGSSPLWYVVLVGSWTTTKPDDASCCVLTEPVMFCIWLSVSE